jgi:hypothetical protein
MLEFAATVPPTVQINGIDITEGLFPDSYPANLHFFVHSITSLPESWTSSYALLHQRLLIGGLTVDMWKAAIAEIFRVLIPGGWAELLEASLHLIPRVGPHSTKAASMFLELSCKNNLLLEGQTHLAEMLQQAGFVNIDTDWRMALIGHSAGEDGIRWVTDIVTAFVGLKTTFLSAGGYGYVNSEEEYDIMVAGAKEEWLNSDSNVSFYRIAAQKPA